MQAVLAWPIWLLLYTCIQDREALMVIYPLGAKTASSPKPLLYLHCFNFCNNHAIQLLFIFIYFFYSRFTTRGKCYQSVNFPPPNYYVGWCLKEFVERCFRFWDGQTRKICPNMALSNAVNSKAWMVTGMWTQQKIKIYRFNFRFNGHNNKFE